MQKMDARRRSNAGIGTDMVCSILRFLDASPSSLLNALSKSSPTASIFHPFLFCVLSPELPVRQLATKVAERIFTEHDKAFHTLQKSRQLTSYEVRKELWGRR